MKQFDEEFSRKAKEAFENYNADHLAGEGWDSFTGKYGRKRKRAFVIPLWARVASVAAILTVVVLLTYRIYHTKADETGNQLAEENRSELTESAANKEDTASSSPEITTTKPLPPSVHPVIANTGQASETKVSSAGQSRQADIEKAGYQVSKPAGPLMAGTVKAEKSYLSKNAKTDGLLSAEANKAAGSLLTEPAKVEGPLRAEHSEPAEMSPEMKLPENPIAMRLTDDADTQLKLKPKELPEDFTDIPREKMTTTFMGGLSGMMASIDNATTTSQGVSVGFYVEQQLTRRISVRPGLAMAKHNYAMEGTSGGSMALDYTAPELNGMSDATTSYEADIEVVSMEVPVNFVFSIRKRARSNLFVATGASTVFYLSQNMSGSFNNTYTRTTVDSYGKVSYESMTTSVEIDRKQELLNRVDLLGLANFSAGYSFPFSKTSHLLFEPFVQLPLRDLTSLDLRIRYGGLSMKIQF
jgi:Outer membrane protein beta-barrel domain